MIDIESQIFTTIAEGLRQQFPQKFPKSGKRGSIAGEYVRAPSMFPHVSVMETDSYMDARRLDSSNAERYSVISYTVEVYSNLTSGKKQECREIIGAIDSMMYALNFTRQSLTPVPNMEDATLYRMVGRYRAETDGEKIYRI